MKAKNSGICLRCKNSLAGLRVDATYCSDKCSLNAYQIALKKKHIGMKNKNCQICNKEFKPNSSMHRLC